MNAHPLTIVGSIANVLALYYLPRRRMRAMYLFVFSSLAFLLWAVVVREAPLVIQQVILLLLNIRTIYIWQRNGEGNGKHV